MVPDRSTHATYVENAYTATILTTVLVRCDETNVAAAKREDDSPAEPVAAAPTQRHVYAVTEYDREIGYAPARRTQPNAMTMDERSPQGLL